MNQKVCEVQTVRVHREEKKMVCVCAFPGCVRRSTRRDCFPKMAPLTKFSMLRFTCRDPHYATMDVWCNLFNMNICPHS